LIGRDHAGLADAFPPPGGEQRGVYERIHALFAEALAGMATNSELRSFRRNAALYLIVLSQRSFSSGLPVSISPARAPWPASRIPSVAARAQAGPARR
jgi:hypothetical protein